MVVLIVYASPGGSTRGIAERIGKRLQDGGYDVELRDAADAPAPDSYEAVIAGSPVYNQRWRPSAAAYVREHVASLRERPTWLFTVSSVGDRESFFPERVAKVIRKIGGDSKEITAMRKAVRAQEHRNFAGAVKRGDWPLRGHLFLRALGGRYGDHRNWPAIDAWADQIADTLKQQAPSLAV